MSENIRTFSALTWSATSCKNAPCGLLGIGLHDFMTAISLIQKLRNPGLCLLDGVIY
jgi:hypothetical protein